MKIQNVKGGYDFLPQEQIIRNYINDTLRKTFEEFGYLPIETPIICYYDILAGKYDENNDILKEIYKLRDQGNRRLGLRYDLTVPFAKFIALNKNEIKFPFKRYEINKVFRDGPVKIGRDREFTQCDVDIVGLSNQMIEAELLSIYVKAFNKLNIDINIKYNSRKLMRGLILEVNVPEKLVSNTITIIDKIDKLTKTEFKDYLLNIGLTINQITNINEFFNLSLKELNTKFNNTSNQDIKEGLSELNDLENYLNALDISKYCEFSSSLARGQDYYTGNVFEVYEASGKLSCAIGGGGRYDKMITDFIADGEQYPAVGISFGLTSIYELLKDRLTFKNKAPVDIYVIPMQTNTESLILANSLRDLGIKVDIEMNNKKLKKSLDYCNKENIPYVIVLGENEIQSKSFILKDMINKKEYSLKMNELFKIKEIITK